MNDPGEELLLAGREAGTGKPDVGHAEPFVLGVDNQHVGIGEQFNARIINIYQTEKIESSSTEKASKGNEKTENQEDRTQDFHKYNFDDPTLPFPEGSSQPRYRFDEGEIGKWAHFLEERRLIAVRSPDDKITSAAVQTLLDLDKLRSHQRRLLAFGTKNQKRDDLILENLLGGVLGDRDRRTILVVDTEEGGIPFIKSTLGGEHWMGAMTEALRVENLLVIVQIASRHLRQLTREFDRFRFLCWNIDFLRPLLYRHQPEGRVEDFFARISKQREHGRWGPPDDDLYLFEVLQPLISGAASPLEEALEEGIAPAAQPSAVKAFKTDVPIYQGILVCAVYFRGLDVTEFAQIVFKLVGDEHTFIRQGDLTPEGKATLERKKQTLRAAWPRVADKILKNCGLIVKTAGGQSTVAFAGPGERDSLRTLFRSSVYFSSVSETLWQAGDLFDHGASQELVDGATSVFVDALAHHKEWQRSQWLSETLIERLSNGQSSDFGELLRKVVNDSLILSRISQVLRALVAHDDYADLVPTWLNDLLVRRGHLPALKLAMYLGYTEGFDYLFWLKRFTDESPDGVRNAAYSALYRHARQSSVRIWDLFGELENWLPEPEKPVGTLSNSNNFALQLVMQYAVDTAEAMTVKDWGRWPSRYPLFRALAQNSESADKRLSSLVIWLFHPAIQSVFRQNGLDLAWFLRAQLLEHWSCLLLGLDSGKTHPRAEATYSRILELFWEHSDLGGRNRLLKDWRGTRELLKASHKKGDQKWAEYLTQRIALSQRLERDFKQLSEQRSPSWHVPGNDRGE